MKILLIGLIFWAEFIVLTYLLLAFLEWLDKRK